jgi:hypothetical protein
MNRLHALTRIQKAALSGDYVDGKAIYAAVRNEIPTSGEDMLMSRTEIEKFADQQHAIASAIDFKVERAKFALDIAEGELRADLLDALDGLDVSDPRDCREVFRVHREVGNSSGPASIREAIDMLAAGGIAEDAVVSLVGRLNALYPPEEQEDE